MDNLQMRWVFDQLHKANDTTKKGALSVEVRLHGSNKKVLLSTGIHLYKNQLSEKNGFTCKNHANALAIIGAANRIYREIEAFALSEKCLSLADVKNWDKDEGATHSVVEFMRDKLRKRQPSMAILEHHNVLIRQIESFGKFRTFADINYQNVADFDLHLRQTIKSQPVIYKRHSAFKSYIVDAINRGLCKSNPYMEFKVLKGSNRQPTFWKKPTSSEYWSISL